MVSNVSTFYDRWQDVAPLVIPGQPSPRAFSARSILDFSVSCDVTKETFPDFARTMGQERAPRDQADPGENLSVLERRISTVNGLFGFLGSGFAQHFGQIFPMGNET